MWLKIGDVAEARKAEKALKHTEVEENDDIETVAEARKAEKALKQGFHEAIDDALDAVAEARKAEKALKQTDAPAVVVRGESQKPEKPRRH